MKKGFFLLAGLVILLSCNDGANDNTTGNDDDDNDHMTQAKRNTEHNREIYRAIETGDVNKLDSFIATDIIDQEGNNGKDIVGLDSLKRHLAAIHTYFEDLKFEIISEGTSLDNNYHFSMFRMTGKSKQNPWDMPVGMDIDDTGIDVVKIRDGKAAEHWSFTSNKDMMEMMRAMGGGNPPAGNKDSSNR
jgi:predicted ester cyclase